jgi:hypothetical protein
MNWTISSAAAEWGVEYNSLAKWLSKMGLEVKRGEKFTTRQIDRAIHGDPLDAERIREVRARADLLEMERLEKKRVLVSLAEVQKMIRDAHIPVRQRFIALPSEMANRCNPTDPKLARDALQQWSDSAMAMVHTELPEPKVK